MDTHLVFVDWLGEDLLKALQPYEDPHCQVGDAEIVTTALGAALYVGGHFKRAPEWVPDRRYLPQRPSASRFNRRSQRGAPLWRPLFHGLAPGGHQLHPASLCLIDSFPSAACEHIRIPRGRR